MSSLRPNIMRGTLCGHPSIHLGGMLEMLDLIEICLEISPKLSEVLLTFGSECTIPSWFEFFNPLYLTDKANAYKTNKFVKYKTWPELQELVNTYKPEVIWSDGDWEANDTYWKSKEFLAWLYNDSPVKDTIVVNDRWGAGTACKHGGFFNCQDKYNPGTILPHKWENAMTLDYSSWGYRRNAAVSDYITPQDLIRQLVSTVSCGGNFLINVGPTKDGMIAAIQEERLLQMGEWLSLPY